MPHQPSRRRGIPQRARRARYSARQHDVAKRRSIEDAIEYLTEQRDRALSPLAQVAYADVLSALEGEFEGNHAQTFRHGGGARAVSDRQRFDAGVQHVPTAAEVEIGQGVPFSPAPEWFDELERRCLYCGGAWPCSTVHDPFDNYTWHARLTT